MKTWKLPGLGMLLVMGMGCGGFFATDDLPGDCRALGCPAGEVCQEGAGGAAHCEKNPVIPETSCHEDPGCPAGHVCVHEENAPAGTPGRCRVGCRVGEDGCAESLFCIGRENAGPGEMGQCLAGDRPQCRVGDGSCNAGHVCDGDDFNMPGRCRKDTQGTPCGTDNDCVFGTVCEPLGGTGTCVPGERLPGGGVGATLRSFRLMQGDSVFVPAQVDEGRMNLHPSFIHENSPPTTVRVVTQGPGADAGLELQTGVCAAAAACATELCEWECILPPSWVGSGGPRLTELHVGFGGGSARIWRYLVASLSGVDFEVRDGAFLGGVMRLCATAQSVNVSPHSFQPQPINIEAGKLQKDTREVLLELGPVERESTSRICREARLPLSLGVGQARMTVSAQVRDMQGTASQAFRLSLVRMECSHNIGLTSDWVTPPLVFTKGRLAFGAGNHLYAFDTVVCASAGRLSTGTVQGPMVALGSSGRIALALDSGLPPRAAPRLALVNVAKTPPTFVYDESSRDCAQGSGGSAGNAVFERGLSLLSKGNPDGTDTGNSVWRFAAPANSPTSFATRLLAYAPNELALSSRCVSTATVPNPFLVPTVQRADGHVAGMYDMPSTANFYQGRWEFNLPTTPTATPSWVARETLTISKNDRWPLYFLAVANTSVWMRTLASAGPAAISEDNHVYEVLYDIGRESFWLRRFPYGATSNVRLSDVVFLQAPVGSPVLGEPSPGNVAEVYVVTSNGGVIVFDAETLEYLWRGFLGFSISTAAQPVLVANADGSGTLWVVGEHGQVRGIRVGNHGLNRKAQWPKAFRDNCNTSSRRMTSDDMLGCF